MNTCPTCGKQRRLYDGVCGTCGDAQRESEGSRG